MKRHLRPDEIAFLTHILANKTEFNLDKINLHDCMVEDMDDGGMGSLFFCSPHLDRILGNEIANFNFTDSDGVPVISTLSLDNFGDLFELDIWKSDFSALKKFPEF